MTSSVLSTIIENYNWQAILASIAGLVVVGQISKAVTRLVPTLRLATSVNTETLNRKMERPSYAENQKWNQKWGLIDLVVIFALILPFCLTLQAQPWWQVARDVFVILLVYDFFYYLTHRFLFHDSRFLGGPLMWVHAVHHRQHNPCRMDASYIHPIEVAIGLFLFAACIVGLRVFMGPFHVMTLVITWSAFTKINQHNHTLWSNDRFPFRYLNYASRMHHNHHARFTGGNFATISLLFDWMFGTLDDGDGWQGRAAAQRDTAKQANSRAT